MRIYWRFEFWRNLLKILQIYRCQNWRKRKRRIRSNRIALYAVLADFKTHFDRSFCLHSWHVLFSHTYIHRMIDASHVDECTIRSFDELCLSLHFMIAQMWVHIAMCMRCSILLYILNRFWNNIGRCVCVCVSISIMRWDTFASTQYSIAFLPHSHKMLAIKRDEQ